MSKRRSLGQHNDEILGGLGLPRDERAAPRPGIGERDEFLSHNQLCRSHSTSVQPAPSSAARPEDPSRMSAGPGRAGSATTM